MLLLAAARGRLVLGRHRRHRRHPAAPPDHVEIGVPQDRGDPGLEVGAGLELIGVGERPHHGLLHEVVGEAAVMGQEHRKGAQVRQLIDDALVQVVSLFVSHGIAPWTLADPSPLPPGTIRLARARARSVALLS